MPKNDRYDETLSRFVDFMKSHNMRQTIERKMILKQVFGMSPRFGVDDLHEVMKTEHHVSRMTVYNTLELLCRCSILRRLAMSDGKVLYELAAEGQINFICTACGMLKTRSDKNLSPLLKSMKLRGFRQYSHAVYIYGLCSKCGLAEKKTGTKK